MLYSIIIFAAVFNAVKTIDDGHCDFESGLCGYKLSDNNGGLFYWERMRSSTPSHNTGPFSAHNGDKRAHYLYTEASSPAQEGDVAMLTSPEITSDVLQCLTFYYNAHGEGMGKLKVEVSQNGQKQELFESSGNKGFEWHRVSKTVTQTGSFKVVFTSIRGPAATSDMAIDDVSLSAGSCTEGAGTNFKPPPVAAKPYVPMDIYGVQRIGCYKDPGQKSFPERRSMEDSKDPITFAERVRECRDIVDSKGEDYLYFGIENYGDKCVYGSQKSSRTKPFAYGPSDDCVMETVGERDSNYIYQSCKDEKSCVAATPKPPATQLSDIDGIKQTGCYHMREYKKYMEETRQKDMGNEGQSKEKLLKYVQECRDYAREKQEQDRDIKYFGLRYHRCYVLKKRRGKYIYRARKETCSNSITGNWWPHIMIYELA